MQFRNITSWPNCNGALIIHLKTQKEDQALIIHLKHKKKTKIPLFLFPTVPVPPSSLTDPPRAVVSDPHASLTHSGWWTQARGAFLLTITRRSKWLLPHYIHHLCTLALSSTSEISLLFYVNHAQTGAAPALSHPLNPVSSPRRLMGEMCLHWFVLRTCTRMVICR